MNIGVFFKHKETGGGIYQYLVSLLTALARPEGENRIHLFYRWEMPPLPEPAKSLVTPVKLSPAAPPIDRFPDHSMDPCRVLWNGKIVRFKAQPLTQELRTESIRNGIELMLYPTPEREAFETGIPYIMAVH
ncbi:MAG: hypothetical protein C4576_03525, partial [Desulfobacteraceae bacterium]